MQLWLARFIYLGIDLLIERGWLVWPLVLGEIHYLATSLYLHLVNWSLMHFRPKIEPCY
jgi:hypothetical protein